MPEHATPEFRRRFNGLPRPVRDALTLIAKSTLSTEVDAAHHEMLIVNLITLVDTDFGEDIRVEMGWCLEQLDDYPIADWAASQN